jgi:putative hemolysin
VGRQVYDFLARKGCLHPELRVAPRPSYECAGEPSVRLAQDPELPKLFRIYLRFGAKVCSSAAIDRIFKTIDFLVMFDVDSMDRRSRQMFFET